MTDKNKHSWHHSFAKEFKKRNNTNDFKPCIAVVVGLAPLKLSVLGGEVMLTEADNLIITEWFKKRCDIDKTFALSVDVPAKLAEAQTESLAYCELAQSGLTAYINIQPPPIDVPLATVVLASVGEISQAISQVLSKVSSSITDLKTEILNLKLTLAIGDYVLVIPSAESDKFFLVDKVLITQ